MIIKPNIIEAIKSLIGAKQRSFLALIGIVVGIGSVIAMVSVGNIVKQEAMRQFTEMGTDTITISEAPTDSIDGRIKPLTVAIVEKIPEACPAITQVAPYSSSHGTLKYNGQKKSVPALGVTPSFETVNKLKLKKGRFIHALDRNMPYCVAGRNVEKFMKEQGVEEVVGTRILFKEKYVTIIGVIEAFPMGGMRPYQINQGLIMPITTVQRMSKDAKIYSIIGKTRGHPGHDMVQSQLDTYLKSLQTITVDVRTAEELISRMDSQMRMFTLLLGAIGSISLVVGGIGVMNVMLVSVTERTREIGIRRALGAHRGDILFQFLIESMILCIIGGIAGVAIGVGASWGIAHFAKWQFSISYEAVASGVGVSLAVGVFFGIYPARQAASLSPILALRSD